MAEQEGPDFQKLKELLSRLDPEVVRKLIPPGGVVTMMFTDIVDSTRINKTVGDNRYSDALKIHNSLVRECLNSFNGLEIKTIGDSFFARFADPREAVACAIQIQQRLAASPIKIDAESLRVRIGIHTGIPKPDPDSAARFDLAGGEVNKAARIESLARGGQVLISEETNTIAKPEASHDWGRWEMKGLGPQRVFEVLWPGKLAATPAGRVWREPVRFLTTFVGRQKEIDELIELVKRERFVTVRSMGGIGKTRLADEAARRLSAQFEDGADFVELAAVPNSEEAIVSELVARFEVSTAGFKTETEALFSALRSREMLLVLDNFEVVMAGAALLRRLLLQCPALRLLLTSQHATSVDGEQLYSLKPMPVAETNPSVTVEALSELDAFKLFRERATHAKSDWELTGDNVLTVAEILELTEGIPLAIELAAARLSSLQLLEIRQGLGKGGRLDFLRRHPSGGDPRHDSMEACLDWSFGLLKKEERALFAALSIFSGGFFIGDVQEVCQFPTASRLIESLREASLVDSAESRGLVRCRMLQVVRDFAARKLKPSRSSRLRRRHAEHFLKVLTEADGQLRRNEQAKGSARIDTDYENILVGVETSRELQEHRAMIDYSAGLALYLTHRGRFALRLRLAEQALRAAELMKDPEALAGTQNNLGNAYAELPTGDRGQNLKRAIACYEKALRVYTERDFPHDWAMTQNNLGAVYGQLPTGDRGDNLKRAIACYEAALRVYTERDFPRDWAATQNNLGNAYGDLPTGDRGQNLKRAIDCYEAALRVRTEPDFPRDWAMTQNNLGTACANLPAGGRGQNVRRAIEYFEAALRVYTERDSPPDWALTQNNLGNAYGELSTEDRGENLKRAIECFEAASRVYTERDFPREWAMTQSNLGNAYVLLPTDREENLKRAIACYEVALQVYTELDFPIEWAMTQNNLGNAYGDLPTQDGGENLKRAIACYKAALRVRPEHDFPRQWAMTQYNLGLSYGKLPTGDRGENVQRAIECLEAAARGFTAAGMTDDAKKAAERAAELKKHLG
jgi:predicted ATPase/class 3 adenylate cyclase